MTQLKKIKNKYYINHFKPFIPQKITEDAAMQAFDFSYAMCFGGGYHRDHRTGGKHNRRKGELFCNTFQGKLAEICIHRYFSSRGLNCGELDFGIYGKNIWDLTDLLVNDKKINIKSAVYFSNLLLLEAADWNCRGEYIPNKEAGTVSVYDYFILVRIQPDIKELFKKEKWYFVDKLEKEEVSTMLFSQEWRYDIPGWCAAKTLQYIIAHDYTLPQNALLNGRVSMDTKNYYIQSGNLKDIEELIKLLH